MSATGKAERSNARVAEPMQWMEHQFAALGHPDTAPDLAQQSSLQGASLMTQSFRNPALLEREGRRLKSWIEALRSELASLRGLPVARQARRRSTPAAASR